jgi:hypothetical protein
MGGDGQMPNIPISTNGPRFYELCSNALNTNTDYHSFNKDAIKSLRSADMNLDRVGYRSEDPSNFVIALPLEMDFTFQQGQTSTTSINSTLHLECSANAPYGKRNNDDGTIKYDGALPILM